MILIRANSRCI